MRRFLRCLPLLLSLACSPVAGQVQYAPADLGHAGTKVTIDNVTQGARIPVRTSFAEPIDAVSVHGYRGVYCAPVARLDSTTGNALAVGGQLAFQILLMKRLAPLSATAIRASLQAAEKASTRAAQYRELFGVDLPPDVDGYDFDLPLDYLQSSQLNMGQELTLKFSVPRGGEPGSLECATPAQIDAAIAEAKRVYAAVILSMAGKSAGPQVR